MVPERKRIVAGLTGKSSLTLTQILNMCLIQRDRIEIRYELKKLEREGCSGGFEKEAETIENTSKI